MSAVASIVETLTEPSPGQSQVGTVSELLESAVHEGVFPGAVLTVSRGEDVVFHGAVGKRFVRGQRDEQNAPMHEGIAFDVGSLSMVLSTGAIMMRLVAEGRVALEEKVSRYLQGFGVLGKGEITVLQLLNHSSGLPAWMPFFEELLKENSAGRVGIMTSRGARDYIFSAIARLPLKFVPGRQQLFSDLGFIILGQLIEVLTGLPLEKAFVRYVAAPLGLKNSGYIDLGMIKRRGVQPLTDRIAPTEECLWRRRVLCGEVHDDNAWAAGGIAGHSGIFSTALDVQRIVGEMSRSFLGEEGVFSSSVVRRFWSPVGGGNHGSYRLAWDSPSRENNMLESGLSGQAVGVSSFTGCSVWVEPQKHLVMTLLSNRINPSRSNKKIVAFRPTLHRAILQAFA